jgi:hypothetical protein
MSYHYDLECGISAIIIFDSADANAAAAVD